MRTEREKEYARLYKEQLRKNHPGIMREYNRRYYYKHREELLAKRKIRYQKDKIKKSQVEE